MIFLENQNSFLVITLSHAGMVRHGMADMGLGMVLLAGPSPRDGIKMPLLFHIIVSSASFPGSFLYSVDCPEVICL